MHLILYISEYFFATVCYTVSFISQAVYTEKKAIKLRYPFKIHPPDVNKYKNNVTPLTVHLY
jgi:hypothetical protein